MGSVRVSELHAGSVKSKAVDVIIMDFAKAFDKVSHLRLRLHLKIFLFAVHGLSQENRVGR